MSDDKNQVEPVGVIGNTGKHNESRRRWLKKGSMASPALLLLANRPAMAASCSISGFMSTDVGTSLVTYDPGNCVGWSPGNWKNVGGQIGNEAWDLAGVARTTLFSSVFRTEQLQAGGAFIRKVVAGVPENGTVNYVSNVSQTFQTELTGGSQTNAITMHAAASYLNASFLKNGGAWINGRTPEDWMYNYPDPADIIGLYLLYEISADNFDQNVAYQLERGGFVLGSSTHLTEADYKSFFESISDSGASDAWQESEPN